MATPSLKFKKMLCAWDTNARRQLLPPLMGWLSCQATHDPKASACSNSLQELYAVNSWATPKEFKEHFAWNVMSNYDDCVSFQEIVKAKLAVPKTNIAVAVSTAGKGGGPRKAIPKKVRGEVWKKHFGTSTEGSCYCCKKGLSAFDDWHVGHIVAHVNGGTDTVENLRPVCGSCNLSMGSEHMDEFKARCYPG